MRWPILVNGGIAVVVALALCGCSASEGQCSYDTDCKTLCYKCDTKTHTCILDPGCSDIVKGACTKDEDCDLVLEYCDTATNKCAPLYHADGGNDGDGITKIDKGPECNTDPPPDCSAPGLAGQGRDRDGDNWGTCCDCDDNDSSVHPGAKEIVYNCKDDDCDPSTPDDDLDHDGYGWVGRACSPGTDCDDHDPNVHPGATEICDNKDNDCDGVTDKIGGVSVCSDGGPSDGADLPASCPDMSGDYHITPYCTNISEGDATITQDNCAVQFLIGGVFCHGTIDAALNFYVDCAGIPVACHAKASLSGSFTVVCSPQCSFNFDRIKQATPCDYNDDPRCTATGQICGVAGKSGAPITVCVNPNPQGRQPGYYCDTSASIVCYNSLCLANTCGAICLDYRNCQNYPGMTCQTVMYNDGQGTQGNISSCAPQYPGETDCTRSTDCSMSRVCSYRQEASDVITVCRPPNSGGALAGKPCNNGSDCETNMCVCGDKLCNNQPGTCSSVCSTANDCVQGFLCSALTIKDQGGTDHTINGCIRDPNSCGRNADCPVGKACRVYLSDTGDSLVTTCDWGSGQGVDNTGADCTNGTQCFAVWCIDYPSYCAGVCISDDDCTMGFQDAHKSCTSDATCDLGFLCNTNPPPGDCQRNFVCDTTPFYLGTDLQGQPIYATANLCTPKRKLCTLETDCRAGEACRLYYNDTATAAVYQCDVGGPGNQQLGTSCAPPSDSSACWTGLCLIPAGDTSKAFCSIACVTDTDCGNPATWTCSPIQVEIRTGYISYVPACVKR